MVSVPTGTPNQAEEGEKKLRRTRIAVKGTGHSPALAPLEQQGRSTKDGPALPDRGGGSIPWYPRCGVGRPRNLLVTVPAQDLDLFHCLPPR